jgi:isopentenyl phosphate kinase
MSDKLVFLKLGGSLITVKNQPGTPRLGVLERLASEIAEARCQDPHLRLLLGHGSGSFGHIPASLYKTRQGVNTEAGWQGFVEVWRQAAELNQLVMSALARVNLPALVFPASAAVSARAGKIENWNLEPLHSALSNGLIPVVYGDAVFDLSLGGTILSTEELFSYLAPRLKPTQLLFAGLEPAVWADYPSNTMPLAEITPSNFPQISDSLRSSAATDVTGGMLGKVRQILLLHEELPNLQAAIFSGETPGNIRQALLGASLGTLVHT